MPEIINIPKKEISPGVFTTGGAATVPSNSPASQTITADSLQPQNPLNIDTPIDSAPSVEGDIAFFNNLANQRTSEEKRLQTQSDKGSKELLGLLGESAGRGGEQLGLEQQIVNPFQRQIADLEGIATTQIAEFNALKTAFEQQSADIEAGAGRKGLTTGAVLGQQGAVDRAKLARLSSKASEIGLIQAQALALQGKADLAQRQIDRAIDLKYAGIEQEIRTKEFQLEQIRGNLTKEEAKRADALTFALNREQKRVEEQKQKDKDLLAAKQSVLNLMIEPEYAKAGVQSTDTLEQAVSKISTHLATTQAGDDTKFGVIGSHVDELGRVVNSYGWINSTDETITPYNQTGTQGNLNLGVSTGSISGLPSYNTRESSPGVSRPVRNNNPGNIKVSDFTSQFAGAVGVESSPALDGGNFLIFDTPQHGMQAVGKLLTEGRSYKGVTAETAIKRYNGGGAYGAATVGLDPKKDFQSQISDPAKLEQVVTAMMKEEGWTGSLRNQTVGEPIPEGIQAAALLISQGQAELGSYPQTLRVQISEELVKPEYKQSLEPSEYMQQTNSRIMQSIGSLREQVGNDTVGLSAVVAAKVPTTQAHYFNLQLNTIKANIAFGALTAMREASKTGGALGQVSERELALLEATLGVLTNTLSPEQFKEQLSIIEGSINRWNQAAGLATNISNTESSSGTLSSGITYTITQ